MNDDSWPQFLDDLEELDDDSRSNIYSDTYDDMFDNKYACWDIGDYGVDDDDLWWGHDESAEFDGDPDALCNGLGTSSGFVPPRSCGAAGVELLQNKWQSSHCRHDQTPNLGLEAPIG